MSDDERNVAIKIIFLDFDGVLNSWQSIRENRIPDLFHCLDAYHVERLNRIVIATGAVVVVSSSWRIIHPIVELRESLVKAGFKGVVSDRTPRLPGERKDEIIEWINSHRDVHDVTSFVAIDDDSDANIEGHFVKTDFETGLQDDHVEKAISILGSL